MLSPTWVECRSHLRWFWITNAVYGHWSDVLPDTNSRAGKLLQSFTALTDCILTTKYFTDPEGMVGCQTAWPGNNTYFSNATSEQKPIHWITGLTYLTAWCTRINHLISTKNKLTSHKPSTVTRKTTSYYCLCLGWKTHT